VKAGLMDAIFVSIEGQMESKGLILKKGKLVDAIIIPQREQAFEQSEAQRIGGKSE